MEDFYTDKFLNLIELYQSESTGCYGKDDINEKSEQWRKQQSLEELLDEIIESLEVHNQIQVPHVPRRHKRYDMKMKDGCSSHTSGLAIAYFAIYVDQKLQLLSESANL